jgi:hypothetical protein
MNDLAYRSMNFARQTAQAGLDATVTIAARTPGLIAAGFDPTGQSAQEIGMMVQEKIVAAHEGALAAQMAWGSFLIRVAFGGVSSPDHVSQALVDVAEAALAPAHRQVRANALRLTGMEPMAKSNSKAPRLVALKASREGSGNSTQTERIAGTRRDLQTRIGGDSNA